MKEKEQHRNCLYRDFGPYPLILNIDMATMRNPFYRNVIWTGDYLQVSLMSIPVNGEIGLEVHPDTDQFIRIESGSGIAMMGRRRHCMDMRKPVCDGYAVIVPAGTWHNIINTGNRPLKIYTIYAPPHHPHGTIHKTKQQADEEGD